jgi:hypothetical protein
VEIAPHFLAKLDLGLITSIDLKFRSQIRGDIGKALHRVLESQRDFYKKGRWSVSLLELCQQINIAKAPIFEIRRMIRLAMAELIRLHYLKQGSNLVTKADRVTFIRR